MANRTVFELEQARERIRFGWTQGASARDSRGTSVAPYFPQAVQFCASGALTIRPPRFPLDRSDNELRCLASAIRELGVQDDRPAWHVVIDWNDEPGRTKEEVLALYARAIEIARES